MRRIFSCRLLAVRTWAGSGVCIYGLTDRPVGAEVIQEELPEVLSATATQLAFDGDVAAFDAEFYFVGVGNLDEHVRGHLVKRGDEAAARRPSRTRGGRGKGMAGAVNQQDQRFAGLQCEFGGWRDLGQQIVIRLRLIGTHHRQVRDRKDTLVRKRRDDAIGLAGDNLIGAAGDGEVIRGNGNLVVEHPDGLHGAGGYFLVRAGRLRLIACSGNGFAAGSGIIRCIQVGGTLIGFASDCSGNQGRERQGHRIGGRGDLLIGRCVDGEVGHRTHHIVGRIGDDLVGDRSRPAGFAHGVKTDDGFLKHGDAAVHIVAHHLIHFDFFKLVVPRMVSSGTAGEDRSATQQKNSIHPSIVARRGVTKSKELCIVTQLLHSGRFLGISPTADELRIE